MAPSTTSSVASPAGSAIRSRAPSRARGFVQLLESFQPSLIMMELQPARHRRRRAAALARSARLHGQRRADERRRRARAVRCARARGEPRARDVRHARETDCRRRAADEARGDAASKPGARRRGSAPRHREQRVRSVLPTEGVARAERLDRRRRRGARALAAPAPGRRDAERVHPARRAERAHRRADEHDAERGAEAGALVAGPRAYDSRAP